MPTSTRPPQALAIEATRSPILAAAFSLESMVSGAVPVVGKRRELGDRNFGLRVGQQRGSTMRAANGEVSSRSSCSLGVTTRRGHDLVGVRPRERSVEAAVDQLGNLGEKGAAVRLVETEDQ
jgi:hypothetical protein